MALFSARVICRSGKLAVGDAFLKVNDNSTMVSDSPQSILDLFNSIEGPVVIVVAHASDVVSASSPLPPLRTGSPPVSTFSFFLQPLLPLLPLASSLCCRTHPSHSASLTISVQLACSFDGISHRIYQRRWRRAHVAVLIGFFCVFSQTILSINTKQTSPSHGCIID